MKQQHHPIDVKTYEKGATPDTNKDILGVSKAGEHVDAKNMRSIPVDGDNSAKKKIKGEELLYPNIDNRCNIGSGLPLSDEYECMMTQEINGYIVEIWAAFEQFNLPALVRIDGKIVLMSEGFPIIAEYPLQYHKNESCIGGEFYITDNRVTPMVFNVKDLLLNSGVNVGNETGQCTDKYFDAFNLEQYVVGISSSLFKIAFVKQSTSPSGQYDFVFGSNGVNVGSYAYSYRYATPQGDRTSWSPVSEMIPVISGKSNLSPQYPQFGNFSKEPSTVTPSTFGNELKIKYDNTSGFEFIEVRRDGWYYGVDLSQPPVSEIIGAFPASSGLNVVRVFDYASGDDVESQLSESDIIDVPQQVERAKSVRYFNSKLWLMNVSYAARDIDDAITFIDENTPVFPTIQKIFKKAHSDVYNATYYKSNMRGEAYGYGAVLFDKTGTKSFVKPIIDNFEFPNRRDELSSESLGTSYLGAVTAATTDATVDYTHEVFDLEDAVGKDSFAEVELTSSFLSPVGIPVSNNDPYNTLEPVSQTSTQSDYSGRPNKQTKEDIGIGGWVDYNPQAFGIDYYSQGLAFKGIEESGTESFDGFSVVQTRPAKRVIAQGLAFYDINPGDGALGVNATKNKNSVIAHFPDLDPDIGLSPQLISELISNTGPNSPYKIEFVSPLGFFSEVYTWYKNQVLGITTDARSESVDMISYCRVLRAKNGSINPGFDDNDGILGGYTAFGTWRDTTQSSSFPGNQNVSLFDIDDFQEETTESGIGTNFRITLAGGPTGLGNIYDAQTASSGILNQIKPDVNNAEVKKWMEPVYVINIVRDDAQVNPGTVTPYNYTGHYIKFKSKILVSDGSSVQSAELVSERWEDCIRSINGQIFNDYSVLERFTWVTSVDLVPRRWLNITGKTPAQIAIIEADIANNGFHTITDPSGSYNVYGTYTHQESTDGTGRIFILSFSNLLSGDIVEVRYDNRIPVRVFGGDTYVNEHIWAHQDNEFNRQAKPVGTEFNLNIPFPMPIYRKPQGYEIVRETTAFPGWPLATGDVYLADGADMKFESGLFGSGGGPLPAINPASIRQLILNWTAETRVNLSFAFNIEEDKTEYSSQFFPMRNYIPRPHKWKDGREDVFPPDADNFLERNRMYEDYYDDYGAEWLNWKFGGFRYKPQVNIDYSKSQNTEVLTSKPTVGFQEEVDFCTRVIWSVTRPINIQDSPSVRTFPPSNFKDISDNTGEIKFAWDADSSKGNNLYAFTNNGVCMILTDKRILSEVNANELATIGTDTGGAVTELWLDKEIGMDRETWKSWAEYSNRIFWVNSTSSYSMADNQIEDIAWGSGYSSLLRTKFIPKFDANGAQFSKMCGVYDVLHKEYYATADNRGQSGETWSTLIYGASQEALQCQSDYKYDKYLAINNKVYGMKEMETYELGVGNLLNGAPYECYLTGLSDVDAYSDKEFIRIRVNSKSKPKRIEFYGDYDDYLSGTPSSIVDAVANPINIKDYYGFECYVPRKEIAPYNRQQGRLLIFKIVSDDDENFFVSTTGVQYKTLK